MKAEPCKRFDWLPLSALTLQIARDIDERGNPFARALTDGTIVMTCDVHDRLVLVQHFDLIECLAALETSGLQKTVLKALECRMKSLIRDAAKQKEVA